MDSATWWVKVPSFWGAFQEVQKNIQTLNKESVNILASIEEEMKRIKVEVEELRA